MSTPIIIVMNSLAACARTRELLSHLNFKEGEQFAIVNASVFVERLLRKDEEQLLIIEADRGDVEPIKVALAFREKFPHLSTASLSDEPYHGPFDCLIVKDEGLNLAETVIQFLDGHLRRAA
jgi:hypothetical protein